MTQKISFLADYTELSHPNIIQHIAKHAVQTTLPYGEDQYCDQAAALIRAQTSKDAAVHFVVGGTLTNLLCLSAMLRPYESIIACDTGHINTNETGAIEATGHKIDTIKNKNGKLCSKDIATFLERHAPVHHALPRAVFISHSSESGSLYSKAELFELSQFCRDHNLYLYLDGARLGPALTARSNDLALHDIAQAVDMFYIGGTKNGAPLGEAVVICNDDLKINFRYAMKQRGALLAKGALLGLVFEALFQDGLYWDLAKHANDCAVELADAIKKAGYGFFSPPETNQIFPILPDDLLLELNKKFSFTPWERNDEKSSVIRLVTSWATKTDDVKAFCKAL